MIRQSSFSSSSAFILVLRFSAAWTASRSSASASASPSASGSPSASAEDSSDPRREFDCDCEWLGDGRCLMSGGAARNGARSMRSNRDDNRRAKCGVNESYRSSSVFVPYLRFRVDGSRRHQSATWRWRVGKVARVANRPNERGAKGKVRAMTLVSVLDRVCPWK